MKKSVSILLMLVAVITLTACSSKLDKTGEEFKNKI
ncbi:TPA: lipoprotein, partial [Enterococcus faecalis]|nr:lipoprotein [Enterococcus faecalis]